MPDPRLYENASVLFMDIVGFSKQPVDQQAKLINLLQSAVNQSPEFQAAHETDLIKLPTGDGMALVFTRNLLAPVQCALEIAQAGRAENELKVRMGIHTGPITRQPDINGKPNIVGDGINLAQRVMDSGDAGHILLSSTVAEYLRRLSHDWSPHLHDLGIHEVKHGVRLQLYNLLKDGLGNQQLPAKIRATRPVIRIFIANLAIDVVSYRDTIRDAVLRLENLPVAMETFSAQPGQPSNEADAVICIVGHRYGYVPPPDLGGDGERSKTWLEVDDARRAGKPVFAFLIDPKAPWTEPKEQDRLTSEPPEKVPEIVKAVQKLQEFKAYLARESTLQTFTDSKDLAAQVTAAFQSFTPPQRLTQASTTRVWQPLFCHALQPAQHFKGRETKLQQLKEWLESQVTPDRVVSVVAAGGTGKTALVDKALHESKLSDRAGVFVWSFYEDPHTDAFLRAAYLYFTGEEDATGGMLERLQIALSGDAPHILILDGLERVQTDEGHRRRGELEDLQLKRLMRWLAGGIGNARALVTSRYPLLDLDDWTGAGHRSITIDDLERPIALEVLRGWGVKEEDAALDRLIEPLNVGGSYHALSVAVLGSYFGNFPDAQEFSIEDAADIDPKARRLTRILEQYVKALTPIERDLLARLSLFPRGVKVEFLGWIVQSGGEVAGLLVGLTDSQLTRHLEKLKALGLVFRYESDRQAVFSAHPFLRASFRNLLGTKPASVHESLRVRLAQMVPSLQLSPPSWPSDPAILDQYELLIEETLLAGRVEEAFQLYYYGLGSYKNLGWALGDSRRGLRILERFVPRDEFSLIEPHLSPRDRGLLANSLGLLAKNLGDLARARAAFRFARDSSLASKDSQAESIHFRNLAGIELDSGHFREACEYSENAVSRATEANEAAEIESALSFRAAAHFALGEVETAAADFQRATVLEGKPMVGLRGIREAECRLLRGDRLGALSQTQANREFAATNDYNTDLCRCHTLLAILLLAKDPAQATQHLQETRPFANRSGNIELQLRCFHSAAELYRHLNDLPQSITEAESGILLADTCGFGKYSIDLRLALAETYLAAGNPHKALQNARNALDRSEAPDCQYAWGKADGLHFCGLAHLRLNEPALARQRLTAALEIRDRLGHGRIEETRRALEQCPPKQ
jgi:class 3 adenylate cyclase/tetratricopeptide (TPR) repeat protein